MIGQRSGCMTLSLCCQRTSDFPISSDISPRLTSCSHTGTLNCLFTLHAAKGTITFSSQGITLCRARASSLCQACCIFFVSFFCCSFFFLACTPTEQIHKSFTVSHRALFPVQQSALYALCCRQNQIMSKS